METRFCSFFVIILLASWVGSIGVPGDQVDPDPLLTPDPMVLNPIDAVESKLPRLAVG